MNQRLESYLWGLLVGSLLCNLVWMAAWRSPENTAAAASALAYPRGCTRWTTQHARAWADEVDAWGQALLVEHCLEMEPVTVNVVMP